MQLLPASSKSFITLRVDRETSQSNEPLQKHTKNVLQDKNQKHSLIIQDIYMTNVSCFAFQRDKHSRNKKC